MDDILGYLITLLLRKNLLDKINIVLVSDHGMAKMAGTTVLVSSLVNTNLINSTRTVYGVVSNVHPVNDSVVSIDNRVGDRFVIYFLNQQIFYNQKETVLNALSASPLLDCYLKENIPSRLNFQKSDRIAPIVCIAKEGYVMNTVVQRLNGNHGFDNILESMNAVFLARGPDFKENVKIGMVKNVDVYPLLCELLIVNCNPNNGTMSPFLNAITFTPQLFK
jgi:predicted AlkP superfamily pyrophosphatase or phosphodiesterase